MGKLWSKRQHVATETFQSVAAGSSSRIQRTMLQFLEETTLPPGQCRLSLNIFVSAYIFVRLTTSRCPTRWTRRKERARHTSYCALDRSLLWMKSGQSMRFYFGSFCAKALFLVSMTVSISLCADRLRSHPHAEVCRSACTSRRGGGERISL